MRYKLIYKESGGGRGRADGNWNCPGGCNCWPAGILNLKSTRGYIYSFKWYLVNIFILLNGTFHMQVVISDVSEAQLTASKNSLRGGLARLTANCPDMYFLLVLLLYTLMRYYTSGNFLSFHSAQHQTHSVATIALKHHGIINITQLLWRHVTTSQVFHLVL